MTEDYKKLLLLLNGIRNRPADYLNRLGEGDFVNMIDAAGVKYNARKLSPPAEGVSPSKKVLHELSFVLDGREIEISFNWAGTLLGYSETEGLL
jgi:hypothetical protein